jgi:hypothetical protein
VDPIGGGSPALERRGRIATIAVVVHDETRVSEATSLREPCEPRVGERGAKHDDNRRFEQLNLLAKESQGTSHDRWFRLRACIRSAFYDVRDHAIAELLEDARKEGIARFEREWREQTRAIQVGG